MAGGAADTAGTAADGTVIIDSELGRGARRRLSRPLDLVFRGFCPEVRNSPREQMQPRVHLEQFMPDEIVPVCAPRIPDPKLRRAIERVKSVRDLEALPLPGSTMITSTAVPLEEAEQIARR